MMKSLAVGRDVVRVWVFSESIAAFAELIFAAVDDYSAPMPSSLLSL